MAYPANPVSKKGNKQSFKVDQLKASSETNTEEEEENNNAMHRCVRYPLPPTANSVCLRSVEICLQDRKNPLDHLPSRRRLDAARVMRV
jgi:hypothetical protein